MELNAQGRPSLGFCAKPQAASILEVVKHRSSGEFQRAFMIVANAIARRVLLQGATEVVLAVNHDPALAEANAFQSRPDVLQLERSVAIFGPATRDAVNWLAIQFCAIE